MIKSGEAQNWKYCKMKWNRCLKRSFCITCSLRLVAGIITHNENVSVRVQLFLMFAYLSGFFSFLEDSEPIEICQGFVDFPSTAP